MKSFFKILLVTFIVTIFPIAAHAESCHVVVDGKELLFNESNAPFVFEGTTYVPVRNVSEALNVPISWDGETKTVHIGEEGGSPILNNEINVFYNGEEQILYNAVGTRVYPIFKDGTNYLPIRALANLFSKTVIWDNQNQTATLLTPPDSNASTYLENTVANTSAVLNLNTRVSISGNMFFDGNPVSSIENTGTQPYSPIGFTLTSYLTGEYIKSSSYMGGGNYFLNLSSERFMSNPTLQKTLFDQNTAASPSQLYMYISTRGGYVTSVTIYFSATITYQDLAFDSDFRITADMEYPENFKFPIIPYPDSTSGDKTVSPSAGENEDSTLILSVVTNYMDNMLSHNARDIATLLHPTDYNTVFGGKSAAQISVELTSLKKKLSSNFPCADGSYTLDSLIYIDPYKLDCNPDNAAQAALTYNCTKDDDYWSESCEILLIKRGDKWYISPDTFLWLYKQ